MKKQIVLLCLSSLIVLAPTVPAANITWVSDQLLDANSQLPDQGYINLLTAAGHTVTRALAATPSVAALNASNLVILGRSGASGSFDTAAETLVWNTQVTVPLISTNSYFSRSSRLGWFTGGPTQPDQVLNPLTFSAGTVADYIKGSSTGTSITEAVIYPNAAVDIRGTSLITDAPVAGATTIATTLAGAVTATYIATWPAGTTLAGTSAGQILSGYRLQFLTGNRESADAPNNGIGSAGYENLTAEGEQMFLRAVNLALNNGVVPEAGSSTLALLAGSLLLTRRRARF
ncbi:MAG: hypothetical protein V4675_06840 [Verrucomicrobiota bacterium]